MADRSDSAVDRTWLDKLGLSSDVPAEAFRQFVDATPDAVVWLEPSYRIIYANESFARHFDRPATETIGRSILDLVAPQRRADTEQRLARVSRLTPDNPSTTIEFRGEHGWLSSVYHGWFDDDGELMAITDRARDIGDEHRWRLELQATNRRLAESNRDLQDFASVASHDLQELLRKVATMSQRLMESHGDVLDHRGLDYLDRMHNATTRMQNLIDAILAFSHVATNGSQPVLTPLRPVIDGILSDLGVLISETGATIEIGELRRLWVDPPQLRQLFQNLIGNAPRCHRRGVAPVIRIASHRSARPDSDHGIEAEAGWAITVADNGIGFENEYREWIFTPSQRFDGRRVSTGSGLGLSVCRRIAERHGGLIVADGRPGEGATFTVWLPDGPS